MLDTISSQEHQTIKLFYPMVHVHGEKHLHWDFMKSYRAIIHLLVPDLGTSVHYDVYANQEVHPVL